ncbi:MAG: beta strand repeat-containing protein [Candidatus Sulfotelmatobacter sp.]
MFQTCRPAGRLFCLVLAVAVATWGVRLAASEGNPARGTEKPAISPEAKPRAAEPAPRAASPAPQSGPTLTSVIDTVYLADGTPAQGVLVITWPAFVAADGTGVAPGVLDVTLGVNGALNVALAPNAGATPANVYYTVVYQLQPSEVRTEYWVVPTSSPATLAQVRTTPGSGTAAQPVSMQYVNSALAAKANNNAVVHLAGTETVTGTKSFSVPPNVPTPVNTGDVANKEYVDSSVANVGSGNYLATAGGAMTGPLTLSGNPTAPLQAADKQYVDSNIAVKADLVSGLVPTSELGSGAASGLNCLLGSGAWGPCGSSANATAIQSVPVASNAPANGQVLSYSSASGQYAPATPSGAPGGVVTGPAVSQNIAQPVGTQLSVNNLSGIRYVTPTDNWSVSPSGSLVGGTQATVTLTPCPVGVDTTGYSMYFVYLSGQGTPEPAMVTGGTCTSGAASGTIVFTPKNTHSATYVLSSASSGIQEAINDACGLPSGVTEGNPNARVVLPATGAVANALPVHGSIFAHCSRGLIEGNGTLLSCSTRDRCMVLGDLVNSNHYGGVTLRGVNFTSTVSADGCQITNTQRQSNVVTITVASGCSTIQTGDTVNINFTDGTAYWGNHGPVTVSGTSISYNQTGANLASVASPGTIAIENGAVEDNATPGTMEDIKSSAGGGGKFNQFFVMDDDQAATIRNFDADGSQSLTCTLNHCGSYVYSANGGAAVLALSNLNISPQCGGNGVTVYNNNTVSITDSVIQGFGMWAVNTQTVLGNYGGTEMTNIYMEEGAGPCVHPYEGTSFSSTGIIYEGGNGLLVRAGEQPGGHPATFAAQNSGSTQYNYYVIANDTTVGWHSGPLLAGFAMSNGTGSVAGQFPHIPPAQAGDIVTYDILRMEPSVSIAANTPSFPMKGACTGGSAAACGSVITGQSQCTGLVCTFTDSSTSANTSSYTINNVSWEPVLPFWPAGVVLGGDGSQIYLAPSASFDTEPGDVVAVNWNSVPEVYARYCGGSSQSGAMFGGAMEHCEEGNPNTANAVATLFLDSNSTVGPATNVKGRLNFQSYFIAAHHIITLVDSNTAKTTGTINFRPPNDANDTYIGLDNGGTVAANAAQLAFGSPVSISNYIGNKGDNASYLERLTASGKTFNVPVNINGNLTVTGTCTGCGGGGSGTVNSGTATQLAMYSANGAAVSGDSGLTDSGTTLTYTGSNGIAAAAGTFSGNLTVNGQLLVAGPWTVSSPVPGTAMAAAGAGTSALGISNDGNFYISANAGSPQKVATTATSSFFSNLFQEDANDLGEYNGTTAQNLHVYSSYTNSSTWQRTSLGFDTSDNYAVVRSESSTSGAAPGLGLWINNGLKWVVDASSNFKPWTDQTYNVGSFNSAGSGSGLRPGTVYVAGNSASGSGFELGKFASESYELCNDTSTGTIINGLAVLTTAGCAATSSNGLTSGAIGVVIANAGTSGVVTLAREGSAYCSFDGSATVVGDYVVPSSTASSGLYPFCHDAGATRPTGTQILGRVLQASAGGTTVQMFLDMPGSNVSSSASYSIPWFTTNTTGTAISFSSTANKVELWGAVLTFPLSTTQVTYYVSTADNTSNTYDIGVLNGSGNIVAHIGNTAGTTFAPSTGWKTLSWTASAILQPGKYYLAITSSCTSSCAQIYGGSSAGFTFLGGSSGTAEGVTAGGTLNNGIAIPADNPTEATIMAWEIH